jgi:hypothetical protein
MKAVTLPHLKKSERKVKEKIKNTVSVQPFLQEKQNLPNVRISRSTVLQKALLAPVW